MGKDDVVDSTLVLSCPETTQTPTTVKDPTKTVSTQKSKTMQSLTSMKTSTMKASTQNSKMTQNTTTPTSITIRNSLSQSTMDCLPCKEVEGGPLEGTYLLQDVKTSGETDPRCLDGCVYLKGEDLYCFAKGEDMVRVAIRKLIKKK